LALIFLTPLVFFTNLTANPYLIQRTLSQFLVLIILTAWLFRSNITKKIDLVRTSLNLPLLLLLAVSLTSIIYSFWLHPRPSAMGGIHPNLRETIWGIGLPRVLFLLLNGLLVFYATLYTIRRRAYLNRVLNTLFTVGGLVSLYGILQYFEIEPIWREKEAVGIFGGRVISTLGNPTFLGSFLLIILSLALGSFLVTVSKPKKRALAGLIVIMFACLVFTYCRSAWLGFVTALLVMAILLVVTKRKEIIVRNRLWLSSLAGIFILIVLFASLNPGVDKSSPKVIERAVSITSVQKSGRASLQRFLMWRTAWEMIKEHPILGQGIGSVDIFYPRYQSKFLRLERYAPHRTRVFHVHNEFLQTWAETGIIGLGILFWLVVAFLRKGWQLLKTIKDPASQGLIMGSLVAVPAALVDYSFNISFHFPASVLPFWLAMGMTLALGEIEKARYQRGRKPG